MAEQRFCKPQVGGSIPLASSNFSSTYDLYGSLRIVWCYYGVRKVGIQPLRSVNQIAFGNAIIAFPHEGRLVADDLHSRRSIHACPPQVRRGTVSQIMEAKVCNLCSLTSRPKSGFNLSHRVSVIHKDILVG